MSGKAVTIVTVVTTRTRQYAPSLRDTGLLTYRIFRLRGLRYRLLRHTRPALTTITYSRHSRPFTALPDIHVFTIFTDSRPSSRSLRLIQIERLVQHAHGEFHVLFVDDHGDLDLGGRNHLDVDALFGKRAK